ncbi:predicted protein [Histoplasma capsulatum G186AR]|uniref:Uncharacterized protein n=1 Tax=Ajellomyces capsulatus (strain G186AR / H82 / ATCC MYA-2454 / RMSCC 2432) TaxID=447093 RepID=C0NU96_AJECG|nr:uncharacterized protein HCBG_06927 [Histoplasma capsulatum G186AR]EEH04976.1 predicted protein [Histoplasma capsulatum G186AR]
MLRLIVFTLPSNLLRRPEYSINKSPSQSDASTSTTGKRGASFFRKTSQETGRSQREKTGIDAMAFSLARGEISDQAENEIERRQDAEVIEKCHQEQPENHSGRKQKLWWLFENRTPCPKNVAFVSVIIRNEAKGI